MTTSDRRIVAVVPVGTLDGAKSRLGAVLDAEERRDLVTRLAAATIRAVVATPAIAEMLVVTPDDEVRALAMRRRARDRCASAAMGSTPACARPATTRSPAARMPCSSCRSTCPGSRRTPSSAILDHARRRRLRRSSRSSPDRHGRGTNALLLAPAGRHRRAFGGDSRAAHVAAAVAAGATVVELDGPLTDGPRHARRPAPRPGRGRRRPSVADRPSRSSPSAASARSSRATTCPRSSPTPSRPARTSCRCATTTSSS